MPAPAPRIGDYPSLPALRRAVANAAKLDIDLAAIELAPGGVIRILTPRAFPARPKDEFEEWDQAGRLG